MALLKREEGLVVDDNASYSVTDAVTDARLGNCQ
jgi:hypothetical protein